MVSSTSSFTSAITTTVSMESTIVELAVTQLTHLVSLDQIHRENLMYLEALSAKHTVDTPLKIINEIKDEKAALKKIKNEINISNKKMEDRKALPKGKRAWALFSNWLRERELEAATKQISISRNQVSIHEENIAYLTRLKKTHGPSVSIYNAVRDEAKHIITLRKDIAKLDWRLFQISSGGVDEKAIEFRLDVRPFYIEDYTDSIVELHTPQYNTFTL